MDLTADRPRNSRYLADMTSINQSSLGIREVSVGVGDVSHSMQDTTPMGDVLDQLSLCTYSTGRTMVREVLDDWLQFLGGRPRRVIFAVSPLTGAPPVYEELRGEGLIDQILYVEPRGRSVMEIDSEALRMVVEAAPTDWVLLIKLDTLPYRLGHDGWLGHAMERIQRHGLFGMTGSSAMMKLSPLEEGYSLTQKFSNNFSIVRRSDWLNTVNACVGQEYGQAGAGAPRFLGDQVRFLNEYAIESHLELTGRQMLVRHESRDWSVFHVNVWGENLRNVRTSYRNRRRIDRFLTSGDPPRGPFRYPWQKYYGYPKPPFLTLMRIVLGRWRRNLFGKQKRALWLSTIGASVLVERSA
jgi:hypothetical protein